MLHLCGVFMGPLVVAAIHQAASAPVVQHLGAPHGLIARLQAMAHVLQHIHL